MHIKSCVLFCVEPDKGNSLQLLQGSHADAGPLFMVAMAWESKYAGSCRVYVLVRSQTNDEVASPVLLLVHRRSRATSDPLAVAVPGGEVERVLCHRSSYNGHECDDSFDFELGARFTAAKALREEAGLELSPEELRPVLLSSQTDENEGRHCDFVVMLEQLPRVRGPEDWGSFDVESNGLGKPAGDGFHAWADPQDLLLREDLLEACRAPIEAILSEISYGNHHQVNNEWTSPQIGTNANIAVCNVAEELQSVPCNLLDQANVRNTGSNEGSDDTQSTAVEELNLVSAPSAQPLFETQFDATLLPVVGGLQQANLSNGVIPPPGSVPMCASPPGNAASGKFAEGHPRIDAASMPMQDAEITAASIEESGEDILPGEDLAACAAANALRCLDLSTVHRALAVGGGEAARGALAILALAARGARVHVAAPSSTAKAAALRRLNEDSDGGACSEVSVLDLAQVQAGQCGEFDLAVIVAGLRDSPAAASAITAAASTLRPGGRLLVALAAGPRPNAVAKAASEAVETRGACQITATALMEAATVQPPPCSDPAACVNLLESAGLCVVSASRHSLTMMDGGFRRQGNRNFIAASVLVEHLACAWAGAPIDAELPQAEQMLFAEIARQCAGPEATAAIPDEILEAEAIRPM